MGQKIVLGPFAKGIRNDIIPAYIDDDSFPVMINAYTWRGRVKRKRGTAPLGRLQRFFDSTNTSYSATATITLAGAPAAYGTGNLLTQFNLEANGNIVPTSVEIQGVFLYIDPMGDGILYVGPVPGFGEINYATGEISILGEGGNSVSASFLYYPDLPVMGLRELTLPTFNFPGTLAFDTTYSYNIVTAFPYPIYDVSFYKNPPSSGTFVRKPIGGSTPTSWNGEDYQQFYTVNYEGALWATNGINVPFSTTHIGMQFAQAGEITYVSNTLTTITVTIANCPLIEGDFVFFNEWTGTSAFTLNFQSGYVTSAIPNTTPEALKTIIITIPTATLGVGTFIPGIIQYLTNRSDVTVDNIRWYDGDPTNGSATNPVLNGTKGWVNFMPPLMQDNFSIGDLPPAIYYLVGCRMILPFKDRLLFIGVVVQSSTGTPKYLQDTVVYSQNGTPYYTASFPVSSAASVTDPTTDFTPILVPDNQTGFPPAYFSDSFGFGGFISAGFSQPILSVGQNEDVLILGFTNRQSRFVYTGNDVNPFIFYLINTEFGTSSTFSSIDMDYGVISRGNRGIIITSQTDCKRIDLTLPDQIFRMDAKDNGYERICSQRDFINEWLYLTYCADDNKNIFPTQTLQYNYREDTWCILNESYTTYGTFQKLSGFTWQTVGSIYNSWNEWNAPWNAGSVNLLQPIVIAGNQQGYVVFRDTSTTNEAPSLYIQDIDGVTVTSPAHCLSVNDYVIIEECLGTIGANVNGKIFRVNTVPTLDTFTLNPIVATGTYLGNGTITRMYVPFIQTKQFPVGWANNLKTRLGPQQYLFTKTTNAQVTLLIFLSQNATNAYNTGTLVPVTDPMPFNNSLIYSTILHTCPESTNIGLTPANKNLMTPTAAQQANIWHRKNISLMGDTVQIGITLSEAQMRDLDLNGKFISQFAEIEMHGMILDCSPGQYLV